MTQRKVVVTDYTFPDVHREQEAAEAAGCLFAAHQCATPEEVVEAVRGADFVAVQFAQLNRAAIESLVPGAGIIRYGIGYDNIDLSAAKSRGLPVGYVPDYCADEVAEHSCAAIVALLRKLPALDASVRRGEWAAVSIAKPMKPFAETVIGFFGFGQIGREVHRRLKGFGFQFMVSDPALTAESAAQQGLKLVHADQLFEQADVVSLHAPTTEQTRLFVNAERLKTMKPNAVLVNTARGALIDEAALAEALSNGTIAGAALDVFAAEPLDDASPLRDAPGLLLTPHVAWYSEAAIGKLQQLVAKDIANHLAGRPLRCPVPGS